MKKPDTQVSAVQKHQLDKASINWVTLMLL
jgi:hypothetical protein